MANNCLIRHLPLVQRTRVLRVQVVRKWSEPVPNKLYQFSNFRMILRDEEGNHIDGKGFGFAYIKFFDRVHQYSWYEIRNFIVVPCSDRGLNFPSTITTNPLVVLLTNETTFNQLHHLPNAYDDNLWEIPRLLQCRYFNDKSYVFVLGGVYQFAKLNGSEMSFYITCESNEEIKCLAKGSCAIEMEKISSSQPLAASILLLRSWKATIQNGIVMLVSEPVSEIVINPRTLEALNRKFGLQLAVRQNVEFQNALQFFDD